MNIYKEKAEQLAKKMALVVLVGAGLEVIGAGVSIKMMAQGNGVAACEVLLWSMFVSRQIQGWINGRTEKYNDLLDEASIWDITTGNGQAKKSWDDRMKEMIEKNQKK